jgi:chlorite dismutase
MCLARKAAWGWSLMTESSTLIYMCIYPMMVTWGWSLMPESSDDVYMGMLPDA